MFQASRHVLEGRGCVGACRRPVVPLASQRNDRGDRGVLCDRRDPAVAPVFTDRGIDSHVVRALRWAVGSVQRRLSRARRTSDTVRWLSVGCWSVPDVLSGESSGGLMDIDFQSTLPPSVRGFIQHSHIVATVLLHGQELFCGCGVATNGLLCRSWQKPEESAPRSRIPRTRRSGCASRCSRRTRLRLPPSEMAWRSANGYANLPFGLQATCRRRIRPFLCGGISW